MYNKILVPIDGSKTAHRAAGHAINLAKLMNVEIELFYVIPETEDFTKTDSLLMDGKVEEEISIFSKLFGQSYITQIEKTCDTHGVKMNTTIERGLPGPKIVEEAKKKDIELIVLGRKKESTETKQVGSVSEYVLNNAKCPVLIVTLSAPDFCVI